MITFITYITIVISNITIVISYKTIVISNITIFITYITIVISQCTDHHDRQDRDPGSAILCGSGSGKKERIGIEIGKVSCNEWRNGIADPIKRIGTNHCILFLQTVIAS